MTRNVVRLPVVPLAEPMQLALGWDMGLTLVGKKVRKQRQTPGPIAFVAVAKRRAA